MVGLTKRVSFENKLGTVWVLFSINNSGFSTAQIISSWALAVCRTRLIKVVLHNLATYPPHAHPRRVGKILPQESGAEAEAEMESALLPLVVKGWRLRELPFKKNADYESAEGKGKMR